MAIPLCQSSIQFSSRKLRSLLTDLKRLRCRLDFPGLALVPALLVGAEVVAVALTPAVVEGLAATVLQVVGVADGVVGARTRVLPVCARLCRCREEGATEVNTCLDESLPRLKLVFSNKNMTIELGENWCVWSEISIFLFFKVK